MLSQEQKRKRTHYQGINLRDLLLIPNLLTLSRALWTIPALVLILQASNGENDLIAAGFLFLAFITDVVDGFWARSFHKISDLGKILDPIVDKFVIISVALALGSPNRNPHLPHWLIVGVISRDSLILIVTLRALHEDHYLFTSSWTGKVATFVLASTLLAYLLSDYLHDQIVSRLPLVAFGFLVLSSVDYLEKYWSVRHKKLKRVKK